MNNRLFSTNSTGSFLLPEEVDQYLVPITLGFITLVGTVLILCLCRNERICRCQRQQKEQEIEIAYNQLP